MVLAVGALVHRKGGDTAAGPAEHVYCVGRIAPSLNAGLISLSGAAAVAGRACPCPAGAAGGCWPCCASEAPTLRPARQIAAANRDISRRMLHLLPVHSLPQAKTNCAPHNHEIPLFSCS